MFGCPLKSSANVNPLSGARMLFSKSVADDRAVLVPFGILVAQIWRSLSNCASFGRRCVAACAFVRAGMQVPSQSLVAGVPAKVVRPLNDDEMGRKQQGTALYHDLTRRCQVRLVEVAPLAQIEPERARINVPALEALLAAKRR
jgi:hypothetical protein